MIKSRRMTRLEPLSCLSRARTEEKQAAEFNVSQMCSPTSAHCSEGGKNEGWRVEGSGGAYRSQAFKALSCLHGEEKDLLSALSVT